MEVFLNNEFVFSRLKLKKHTKEPNKEQSRAAKKKLAMEYIIFSNNSKYNADGCFKLHKYT